MFGLVFLSEVKCGPPPTVARAKAETTGSRYLDRTTYTCESGYFSDGPQNHLVCGKRSKWEGDEIVCGGNPAFCNSIRFRGVSMVYKLVGSPGCGLVDRLARSSVGPSMKLLNICSFYIHCSSVGLFPFCQSVDQLWFNSLLRLILVLPDSLSLTQYGDRSTNRA